jgi:hypothetical protein
MKELCVLEEGDEIILYLKACPDFPVIGKVSNVSQNDDWVAFERDGYECYVDAQDLFMIGVKMKVST